jgi:uncharacterized protein (TIGR02246 family)
MNNSEQVKQAIQENFKQMKAAMVGGNAQKLATYFTEDAFVKFPGMQPMVGRKAVEQGHQHMIEQGIAVQPNTQEVKVVSNTANEIGTFKLMDKEGRQIDQGHYATIWEKEGDRWLISRDVISSTKEVSPEKEAVTDSDSMQKEEGTAHLYVELWNPTQAWLDLSPEDRKAYFTKVGGEIQKLTGAGVEVLGFAVNDNDKETPHRSDHRYVAVWEMPSKEQVKMLEDSVSQAGWYNYFEQVNARGKLVSPPTALEDMISLT